MPASHFSKNSATEIRKSAESLHQLTLSSEASRASESRVPSKVRSMTTQFRTSKSPVLSGRSSGGLSSLNKPRFRYDSNMKRSSEMASSEDMRLSFRAGMLGEAVDKAISYFREN